MKPRAITPTIVAAGAVLLSARASETLLVPYDHSWEFMQPMGTNPANLVGGDPDFDSTWWLAADAFAANYDGPAFGVEDPGTPSIPSSTDSGTGPGPLGYGGVDNWNGLNDPLLLPFDGNPAVTSMGTLLTTPSSGNRRAAYFRTTFTTTQPFISPILRCMTDDGAVIFLDGVQVVRLNLTLPTPGSVPLYMSSRAITDATPEPVAQSTENTLHTIDLSVAGNQGTPGGLQAKVINPVSSLATGTHTLAVFLSNSSNTSADLLLALQLTGDSSGIFAAASNVTRNAQGTPANPADDTFGFDITVTQFSAGTSGWASDYPPRPAGVYDQAFHVSGFSASAAVTINFHDVDVPALTSPLTVVPPPSSLWIGHNALPGNTGPLLSAPGTAIEWVQTGVESVQLNNGGGTAPHELKSAVVPIPPAGATFGAILEFEDASQESNFEAMDTLQALLILDEGVGISEINLVPAAVDDNADGILSGYSGIDLTDYNDHLIQDEFNLAGRLGEASWTEGLGLHYTIPPRHPHRATSTPPRS